MQHIIYFILDDDLNFLKDILPAIISGLALITSVVIPYLLIRYEKIYILNKDHKEFLRKIQIYFLEWLNISSYNSELIEEILDNPPNVFILKDFQFYEFPSIDLLKTYNNDLLNEFYVQIRKLKSLDHYLKTISIEFSIYKKMLVNKESPLPVNGDSFFRISLMELRKQQVNSLTDITKLRVKVRLLLNEINQIDSLEIKRFFSFDPDKIYWYKKDLQFSEEEIKAEEVKLEQEKQNYQKRNI